MVNREYLKKDLSTKQLYEVYKIYQDLLENATKLRTGVLASNYTDYQSYKLLDEAVESLSEVVNVCEELLFKY